MASLIKTDIRSLDLQQLQQHFTEMKEPAYRAKQVYQWLWEIDNNFNWYAGAGAGLGSWSTSGSNGSFAFVAGDVGIEYNFKDAPILLSLDYRPEFGGHGYFNNKPILIRCVRIGLLTKHIQIFICELYSFNNIIIIKIIFI